MQTLTRLLMSALTAVSLTLNPVNALPLEAPAPVNEIIEETKTVEPLPQVARLIKCESGGKNVTIIDSNGEYSRGILQFQDKTWDWFSELSGIQGTSTNISDSIRLANWAVANGYGNHWTCWKLLGLHNL